MHWMRGVTALLRIARKELGACMVQRGTLRLGYCLSAVGAVCAYLELLVRPNTAPLKGWTPSSDAPAILFTMAVSLFVFAGISFASALSGKRNVQQYNLERERICQMAAISLERILAHPFERKRLNSEQIDIFWIILRVAPTAAHTAELLRENRITPDFRRPLSEVLANLEATGEGSQTDISALLDFANVQLGARGYFDEPGRLISFRLLTMIVGVALVGVELRGHVSLSSSLPVMSLAFLVPLMLERALFRHDSEGRKIAAATKASVLAAIDDGRLSRSLDEDHRRLLDNLSRGDRTFGSASKRLERLSKGDRHRVRASR